PRVRTRAVLRRPPAASRPAGRTPRTATGTPQCGRTPPGRGSGAGGVGLGGPAGGLRVGGQGVQVADPVGVGPAGQHGRMRPWSAHAPRARPPGTPPGHAPWAAGETVRR